MALLLPSSSSLFLQDNIQLVIYSRTHSETIKKDIVTMPHREQNRGFQCSPAELMLRTAEEEERGEGSGWCQRCGKVRWSAFL